MNDSTINIGIQMNKEEFNAQYPCTYTPSQRYIDLCDKLEQYDTDTEKMAEPYLGTHYRIFYKWREDRGYTQKEVNAARNSMRL